MPGFHDSYCGTRRFFYKSASQLLGGAGALLASTSFFANRRGTGSGGLAPGLFLLHEDHAAGSTDLQDRAWTIPSRENGCLKECAGSRWRPDLPKPVLTGEMDGIRSSLPRELKNKFEPVAVELKKGESAFHHARTMHGSGANDTPRPPLARDVINVSFAMAVMSNAG